MFVFFKQKTAYEMRISDWSSDVCSSDLFGLGRRMRAIRQDVQKLPLVAIAYADLDFFHAIEHVELGDAKPGNAVDGYRPLHGRAVKIGRASCRESVCQYV